MAKFLGVNCTLAQPGPTRAPITGGDGGGNERCFYDEYVTLGTEAVNDTIQFGPPSGALLQGDRVVGVSVWTDALAGAGNAALSLGDDGSAARYISSTDLHAAQTAPTNMNVRAGYGFQLDQDRPLLATVLVAAPAAAKKISVTWRVLRS